MFIYIKEEDLKNEELMQNKIKSLEHESIILEAKLGGVKEYIAYIEKELSLKKIREHLSQKGIREEGEKVQLEYSNGTWLGVTMGFRKDNYSGLKVHLMLKNKKGWHKTIDIIHAENIHVMHKTEEHIPEPPKVDNAY